MPGGPEAQVLVHRHARPGERGVPGARFGLVPRPRGTRRVKKCVDVMDDADVPRPEVDRRDVRVAHQVRGDHEAAVGVGPRGGDREFLGRLEDEIGRPQLPVRRERERRRHVLGVAPWRAGLGPRLEDGDLLARERLVVLEPGSDPGLGLPGRHLPFAGHQRDVRGALPRLFEGLQGKGADVMAAMAVLALLLEDRRHVLGECRRLGGFRRLCLLGRLVTPEAEGRAGTPSRRRSRALQDRTATAPSGRLAT